MADRAIGRAFGTLCRLLSVVVCDVLYCGKMAQRSVVDGTNRHSSSKPCAYCRIVQSSVSSVCLSVCLSCDVLYCGEMVRLS